MAESNLQNGARKESGARLKRNVTKMAFRSREKVLRSLGRGDETKDEIIDNYVHLVNKQQAQYNKFQHEMKRYLQSVTAMQIATGELFASLSEIFEEGWLGKDVIASLAKSTDFLYNDLHARLNTEVITIIQDHLMQCNEMKGKVSKRGRKLVDFDAARRNLASLQATKKTDDTKLSRAQDSVTGAHETYESMNSRLHVELPDLHDSRVVLSTDIIKNISNAEKTFYNELAEIHSKLVNVVVSVRDSYDEGEYRIQRLHSPVRKVETIHKSVDPATLPADEVTGQRSRGHSERSSGGDRRHSGGSNKQARSSHNDDRRQRYSNEDSHQYVNIRIGKPLGESDTDKEQTTSGENPNNEKVDQIKEASVDQPEGQQLADKPKPSPRQITTPSLSISSGHSQGEQPRVIPKAKPRNVTSSESELDPSQQVVSAGDKKI